MPDLQALFKEITMTADLMKQMVGICDIGEAISESETDKNYYADLRDKLFDAIDLLNREPII